MIYILSDREFKGAINLPVIGIRYFELGIDISTYDALIFSSKNGVLALESSGVEWREIPAYSIGRGTSLVIKELSGNLVYEAKNSYGDNFAHEIKDSLEGKRVLFLRAKVVSSNLNTILKESGVLLDEYIIYETICNNCNKLKTPDDESVIIFSSPSTIECFFKCFEWDSSYKAVVIGKVTASHMPNGVDFFISESQNIPSCIKKANEILLR